MSEMIELQITALTARGDGLGIPAGDPQSGKKYFVPFTAPGDVVLARPARKQKGKMPTARLVEIVQASQDRVEPVCGHFKTCGGCQWQHVNYATQLMTKRELISRSLKQALGDDLPEVEQVVPSETEYGYRHRAQLSFRSTGGRCLLGFKEVRSHKIVNLSQCPILAGELEKSLPAIQQAASSFLNLKQNQGEAFALQDQAGNVFCKIITRGRGPKDEPAMGFFEVRDGKAQPVHEATGWYEIEGTTIGMEPGVFAQANLRTNEAMVRQVMFHLEETDPGSVLDVYSGTGNYSLPAAAKGMDVHGVEQSLDAVRLASLAAGKAELKNVRFSALDAAHVLDRLRRKGESRDVVICNPPRTGLERGIAEHICSLNPKAVVYVSCSPVTLARDLKTFVEKGYRLKSVKPFDLFPQTFHVETVAYLVKN